jgi:hypothetical protein
MLGKSPNDVFLTQGAKSKTFSYKSSKLKMGLLHCLSWATISQPNKTPTNLIGVLLVGENDLQHVVLLYTCWITLSLSVKKTT